MSIGKEINIKYEISGDVEKEGTIDYQAIEEKILIDMLKGAVGGGFVLYATFDNKNYVKHRVNYERVEE